MTVPVFVGRDKTRRAVEHAMAGDRRVLVVAQRQATDDDPGNLDSLYPVGVTASVINCQTQVDGVLKVWSPASSEPRSFTWSTPTFWRRRSRQSKSSVANRRRR